MPSVWLLPVSPEIATQEPPAGLQRSDCRLVVEASVHSPALAVSVCPSRASPDTAGGEVFVGAAGSTSAVCAEVALVVPPAFVALTWTRSVVPTSSASRV